MGRKRLPVRLCTTAEEWVEADLERQIGLYKEFGNKAPKLCAPTPEELPDANERARAVFLQYKVCTKDGHVGDRILTPDMVYGKGRICKTCICDYNKVMRQEAAVRREEDKVGKYQTAEDWFAEASTANSCGSRYFPPDRVFFPSEEEFEKAMSLHTTRIKEGGDGRQSLSQYMERDNANKRAKYSKMSKQEKWVKYDVISNSMRDAPRRGINWNISSSKEKDLRSETKCYFCHREADPSSEETVLIRGNQCRIGILGIDRLEPVPSYDDDGVVSACFLCNASKGGWGYSDFVNFCKNVSKFQETGNPTQTFIPYQRTVRRPSSMIASSSSDLPSASDIEYDLNGVKWTQKTVLFNKSVIFSDFAYGAKRRGLPFEICKLDYENITSMKCVFCGFYEKGRIGLDRIDTSEGYKIQNIQPCCVTCNHARGDLKVEDFIDMCHCVTRIHSTD